MNNNNLFHPNTGYMGSRVPYPTDSPEPKKNSVEYPSRKGINIGVTPGAVIGALVSGAITKKQIEEREAKRLAEQQTLSMNEQPSIEGNYYKQVKDVIKNLQVVFTPISAVYVIDNKGKKFTLDTVETSEMNTSMKSAWKAKDESYFKGLMATKMMSEMQIAEEAFAKQFLKKHASLREEILQDGFDTSFIDELNHMDTIKLASEWGAFFDDGEVKEKIACAMCDDASNDSDVFYIQASLSRPIEKHAGILAGIKSSLGFGESEESIKSIKKKMSDPSYVMKNVKIGFMPDRVIYSLENQMVGTLSLTSMNEEGYSHFLDGDTKYFKNFLCESIKQSMKKNACTVEISSSIEKQASEDMASVDVITDMFVSSNTHPVTLYLLLTTRLGLEWLSYDIAIIDEIVKKEFGLEDISDATHNKLMTMLIANQSENCYTSAFVFEKAALSFASKPVDLFASQKESINIQDIVFAIDVLDRITPYEDIYDNFSKEVINYISDVLSEKEMYVYSPQNIVGSPLEPAFNEMLNEFLLKLIKGKMTLASSSKELDAQVAEKCEYVADNSSVILKSIRRYLSDNKIDSNVNRGDLIDVIMNNKNIKEEYKLMIKRQVVLNLAVDDVLSIYESALQDQVSSINVQRPE